MLQTKRLVWSSPLSIDEDRMGTAMFPMSPTAMPPICSRIPIQTPTPTRTHPSCSLGDPTTSVLSFGWPSHRTSPNSWLNCWKKCLQVEGVDHHLVQQWLLLLPSSRVTCQIHNFQMHRVP